MSVQTLLNQLFFIAVCKPMTPPSEFNGWKSLILPMFSDLMLWCLIRNNTKPLNNRNSNIIPIIFSRKHYSFLMQINNSMENIFAWYRMIKLRTTKKLSFKSSIHRKMQHRWIRIIWFWWRLFLYWFLVYCYFRFAVFVNIIAKLLISRIIKSTSNLRWNHSNHWFNITGPWSHRSQVERATIISPTASIQFQFLDNINRKDMDHRAHPILHHLLVRICITHVFKLSKSSILSNN